MVVNDGAVAVPAGYGAERIVCIVVTQCAQGCQFLGKRYLRLRRFQGFCLQPQEESGQCHCITAHGLFGACYLYGVLDRHHHLNRTGSDNSFANSRVDSLIQGFVHTVSVHQNALGIQTLQMSEHIFIVTDFYACMLQVFSSFSCQFAGIDKQRATAAFHHAIGDDTRCIIHIRTADIQQPAYLVQCRDYNGIGLFLCQRAADACQFAFHAFTGIFFAVRE